MLTNIAGNLNNLFFHYFMASFVFYKIPEKCHEMQEQQIFEFIATFYKFEMSDNNKLTKYYPKY